MGGDVSENFDDCDYHSVAFFHRLYQLLVVLVAFLFCIAPVDAYFTYQLTDSAGRVVVPGEYHHIEPLPNGLYLLDNFNPEYPTRPSYKDRLIDASGKEIAVNLPNDCTLAEIFYLSTNKINETNGLPPNVLLLVRSSKGFGLLNSDDISIIESVYEHIFRPDPMEPYKFAVCDGMETRGHNLLFWFDARTLKRSVPVTNVFLTDNPQWQKKVGQVAENRVVQQVNHDEFNTAVFRHCYGSSREQIFNQFLKEYKLIGMPRPQLEKLLGYSEPLRPSLKDHVYFGYISGVCGNTYSFLEIELRNDIVLRWRIVNHAREQDRPEPWVTH